MPERTLREQHYRELLEERYGPLDELEAERHGPTPPTARRGRRFLERLIDAQERLKEGPN